MKVAAVVASAGSGRRMRSKVDKPFIRLYGKEIIEYVLKALQESSLISEIIVASNPKNIPKIERLIRADGFTKVKEVVRGGRRRLDSVFLGLSRVSTDVDFVLVHDVARPFITQDLIRRTVRAAKEYGASLSAVLVKPTIKEVMARGHFVKRTLDRSRLWEAQTPQVFRRGWLLEAYRKLNKSIGNFTDDASLVEETGRRVKVVMGSYNNIKITTPEDLIIAESILKFTNDVERQM